MDITKILAISGRPGLFQMNAQTRGGVVATSLLDGKRIVTSAAQQISVLSEIRIYCIGKEVPLIEVFEKMLAYEKGGPAQVKPKAPATDLEAYFFEVLEDYDEERVYPSDIKKIIQWYNLLVDQKIIALPKPKSDKKEKSDAKSKNQ